MCFPCWMVKPALSLHYWRLPPPNGFKVIALGHRKSAGLGQFDVGAHKQLSCSNTLPQEAQVGRVVQPPDSGAKVL